MMLKSSAEAVAADHDVCIVGAGPVGIALALACEEQGLSVLLLESGGDLEIDASTARSDPDPTVVALHGVTARP